MGLVPLRVKESMSSARQTKSEEQVPAARSSSQLTSALHPEQIPASPNPQRIGFVEVSRVPGRLL